jgi:N-acetylmuramoyl-L-alanine amidase
LHQRADIANSHKADLYISIHANGNVSSLVSGTETLVLGLHRAEENFEVAKKENSVILLEDDYSTHYEGFDPGSPESYMIFSLMQNLYFEQSINFAAYVQNQFRDRASRKDRGVKQQGLLVLARTSMPGVLIETGFVTNPEEEKFLLSEQGQDYIASAIFRAFRDYRNMMESRNMYFASRISGDDTDVLHHPADTFSASEPVHDASGPYTYDGGSAVQGQSLSPVIFKIQILASATKVPLSDSRFRDYNKVTEYKVGKIYKYAVDGSGSYDEINANCKKLQEHFPGAFVIAVRDSSIIPVAQALKEFNTTNKIIDP